jgi:hypothetical protein
MFHRRYFHGDFQGIENSTADEDVFEELERLGSSVDLSAMPGYSLTPRQQTGRSCVKVCPRFFVATC